MDWLVGKGATPSQYTGPQRDHTTGGLFGKSSTMSCRFLSLNYLRKISETWWSSVGNNLQ